MPALRPTVLFLWAHYSRPLQGGLLAHQLKIGCVFGMKAWGVWVVEWLAG